MVRLEQVSRRYQVGDNEVYALRDVDLEVDQGEFAVVPGALGQREDDVAEHDQRARQPDLGPCGGRGSGDHGDEPA
jgi:ABC-type ATPase involved in cell division